MARSRRQHEFLDSEEWESWGALLMLHHFVLLELDAELRRQHDLPVTEFDVVITLFNAPGRRLRMSQLAQRVLLSPAGTTHLVTRLERDRLVRREVDPTDGRKWFAVLTDDGDRARQAARPTHNERAATDSLCCFFTDRPPNLAPALASAVSADIEPAGVDRMTTLRHPDQQDKWGCPLPSHHSNQRRNW